MWPNRKKALEQSDKFVDANKQVAEKFEITSTQQQEHMDSLTSAGLKLAREKAQQQRKNELQVAYGELLESGQGLLRNFDRIKSLNADVQLLKKSTSTVFAEEDETNNQAKQNQELEPTEDHVLSLNPPDEKRIMDLMLQEDPELVRLSEVITLLTKKKHTLKLEDSSAAAYEAWCKADESVQLTHAGESDLVKILNKIRASRPSYAEWKDPIEQRNQRKIQAAQEEIELAKKIYAVEKQQAQAALGNYELSRKRYDKQLINSSLSIEQTKLYSDRFLSQTDFNSAYAQKIALMHAKTIIHPQSNGLIALLTYGRKGTDENWRNMSNFHKHPLPRECFDYNIAIGEVLVQRIQEQATKKNDGMLRIVTKTGKAFWSAIVPSKTLALKIAGTMIFEGTDLALGDADRNKMGVLKERLDKALDASKQLIPRIAGSNEAALKEMYNSLNATLEAVADHPETSDQICRLLYDRIESNQIAETRQLEDIRITLKQTNIAGAKVKLNTI